MSNVFLTLLGRSRILSDAVLRDARIPYPILPASSPDRTVISLFTEPTHGAIGLITPDGRIIEFAESAKRFPIHSPKSPRVVGDR